MTLNILFFTITIKKRQSTLEEALHDQMVEKMYQENQERVAKYIRHY
ncbi:tandem small hypothetical protein [Mesobacillus persicus]|uniref:Sporulation protein (Bac_small_yrzI) n=1 Tax=Mesobacillus persicus TaxID=930146 RepID=A0A1H7XB73_9BACI|nr:YrzI family small protein [Mesobacillus persicus]SEM30933.1 tandem small hypothetical protein [Mesobacillus persicus]